MAADAKDAQIQACATAENRGKAPFSDFGERGFFVFYAPLFAANMRFPAQVAVNFFG